MTGSVNRTLAGTEWILRLLLATTVLQTWIICASMCGVVLLYAATHFDTVHNVLGVVTALAEACVRIALHALAGS